MLLSLHELYVIVNEKNTSSSTPLPGMRNIVIVKKHPALKRDRMLPIFIHHQYNKYSKLSSDPL